MQEQAFGDEAGRFDLIHSHLDFLSFPLSRRCATPVLTTLHEGDVGVKTKSPPPLVQRAHPNIKMSV